jgi:hypothetical protein
MSIGDRGASGTSATGASGDEVNGAPVADASTCTCPDVANTDADAASVSTDASGSTVDAFVAAAGDSEDVDASTDGGAEGGPTQADASDAQVAMATPCGALSVGGHVLLELGHSMQVGWVQQSGSRVLSEDYSGHWSLFDSTARTQIVSGNTDHCPSGLSDTACVASFGASPGGYFPVQLAGGVVAIPSASSVTLRAATDGHVLQTVAAPAAPSIFGLASDGSYLWAANTSGLMAWSPSGQLVVNRPGDYLSLAQLFAAPGEIRVAMGPRDLEDTAMIERISTSTGSSTITSPYSGQFGSWFLDGARFLASSRSSDTVLTVNIYGEDAALQSTAALPSIDDPTTLVGQGNYFWTQDGEAGPVNVYAVGGGATPVWTSGDNGGDPDIPSGNLLALFPVNGGPYNQLTLLDLSGPQVSSRIVTFPVSNLWSFAADAQGNWAVSTGSGVVFESAALGAGVPLPLNCGAVQSIAGSDSGRVAIATGAGQVLYANLQPGAQTLEGSLALSASSLQMSSDGTVVLADGTTSFSLPAGTTTTVWPGPSIAGFSLARGGGRVGRVTDTFNPRTKDGGGNLTFQVSVSSLLGDQSYLSEAYTTGTDAFSAPPPVPIALSPSGTFTAVCEYTTSSNTVPTTTIYGGGTVVGTASGYAVGWLDDSRLLVGTYVSGSYAGSTLCETSGNVLASLPLPQLSAIRAVGTSEAYAPGSNTIYNLADGTPVWTSPDSVGGVGDIAGNYVVFASGPQVFAESY